MKNKDDELSKILINYSNDLSDKISEIELLLVNFLAHQKLEDLNSLYFKIHNVHGSAKTFGYSALSETAMELNQALSLLKNNFQPVTETQKNRLYDLFNKLKKASLKPDIDFLSQFDNKTD